MSTIAQAFAAVGLQYEETDRGAVILQPIKHGRCPKIVIEQRLRDFWVAKVDYNVDGRRMVHVIGAGGNSKNKVLVNVLREIQFRLGLISQDEYRWGGYKRGVG